MKPGKHDPRGPYRSHTDGMTPAQAAEWFAANGSESTGRCSTHESLYVNAGSLPTGAHDPDVPYEDGRKKTGEYYCQGSLAGVGGKF